MSSQSFNPFVDAALQYCDDILTSKIPACKQVKQAVKRHLDDLNKIDDPSYPFTFDISKAEKICRFAEKMPHVKGRWASSKNNHLKLEPWQSFFLTSIFGWVEKETGFRRFREAVLLLPKKNGKSFLGSIVLIWALCCDNEPGADIFSAANSLDQAKTIFDPCKRMIELRPALRERFEIEVMKESITIPDGSKIVPLIGIPRDGSSSHAYCLDEYHEADDDNLYYSLKQSTVARTQPLGLVCSTAGVTIEGPCHQLQKECEEMLDGSLDRPELFALIYGIDKDTDWTTEEALRMANPNLGVSVNLKMLLTDQQNAIRKLSKQASFKTKHLNVWCSSSTAFFDMQHWIAGADSKLKEEDFRGKQCWMAADLSAKLDLTCVVKLFKDGNTFYVFPKLYLPEARAEDPTLGSYARWTVEGALTATEGNVIDIDQVIEDTVADIQTYNPLEFAFDKWRSELYIQTVGKRCPNLALVDVPMGGSQYLSPAMFEIEALLADGRIKHPNNPVANWCMSNVASKPDPAGHAYPRKAGGRAENKIDFGLCLILAMGRAMLTAPKRGTPDILFA
jgi:phage terminase large subunit-like protein